MPQLKFHIEEARPVPSAAAPTIAFKLRVTNTNQTQSIHSIALRCEIQIQSMRRKYGADEQKKLVDLFGEPARWSKTLHSMHWHQLSTNVHGFTGETTVNLLVPCSFDFNIAATKYFGSLRDGNVPLCFLFSGTIFYSPGAGQLQIQQIPWDNEAKFQLPVLTWKQMMEAYYPNEKWLAIRGDIFDRLVEYQRRRAIPTWDQALESLLSTANHIDDRPLMTNRPS